LLRILRSSAARSAGDAVVGNGFQTRDGSPDSIRGDTGNPSEDFGVNAAIPLAGAFASVPD
jgi:hypothetical protein